jgi:hypothetical protein
MELWVLFTTTVYGKIHSSKWALVASMEEGNLLCYYLLLVLKQKIKPYYIALKSLVTKHKIFQCF